MRGVQQWNSTRSSWANTGGQIPPQGDPIGVTPEFTILVSRKNKNIGRLKRNLIVTSYAEADSEANDELDGEEL
ncbi:hypothetical protein O181_029043 [Austropuccinia psidii MF-1]|uniref:Uncharacterized protein n=1 Tax=Austropuccinia psidii MF-1 TaxID=1389203 RepID=A0A9Q3CV02_9BASI|nr:hypothetical protein [Austropuccinia psidii MF-1]